MSICFKIKIWLVLSLACVCMCKQTNYLFYSYTSNGKIFVNSSNVHLNPVEVPNWTAQAFYNASQNQTGWDLLEVHSNPSLKDEDQAYQSGYIEGYVTRQQIWNYYWNNVEYILSNKSNNYEKVLTELFDKNSKYINKSISDPKNLNDPYWYQVMLVYKQLSGLADGYNAATNDEKIKNQTITYNHFVIMNFQVEWTDILTAYERMKNETTGGTPNRTSTSLPVSELREERRQVGEHCSVLIKVVPGNTDVYIGHNTWTKYIRMSRILKRYKLALRVSSMSDELIPGMSTTFSSYPGVLFSVDDFYVMNSGMVAVETTLSVFDLNLFKNVHPENEILEEVRNVVANRLAHNGTSWMNYFKRENSGTYNNQWMIIDLNKFLPGFDPKDGFLTVMEQLPGYMEGRDETNYIKKHGYWASYNIPFYQTIYNMSGFLASANNNSWFSYADNPRARIFKRDQSKVIDLNSMISMMRYNSYENEIYSVCDKCSPKPNACNAIASRCDLNPPDGNYTFPALQPFLFGAIDAKIISYSMFEKGEMLAIGGPTTSGVPPFSWSKTMINTTGVRHMGQPDTWDFPPLVTSWLLPYIFDNESGEGASSTTATPIRHKSSSIARQPVSAAIALLIALSIVFI